MINSRVAELCRVGARPARRDRQSAELRLLADSTPPSVARSARAFAAPLSSAAGPALDRVSFRNPRTQQLGGIDTELSAAFAQDLQA